MSNDVTISVTTKDQASAVLGKIGDNTETMTQRAGKSIAGLGQKIGGELGEIVTKGGEGLEEYGQHGQSMSKKLTIAGGVVAGLGVTMMSFGSGAKQSQQQLDAAIQATGDSVEDFSKQIDAAKSKAEDFGHSGIDAENALTSLTTKTGSAATALKYMGLVEDLAAVKHVSLTSAADMVAKALDGNTKLFKQYGIVLDAALPPAEALDKALAELSAKLNGQASASVDNFNGKLNAMRQHATDAAEAIANKIGPAATIAGTTVGIVSGVVDIFSARSARLAMAQDEAAASILTESAAAGVSVGPTMAAALAQERLAAGGKVSALGMAEFAGKATLAVGAVVALGVALEPAANKFGDFLDNGSTGLKTLKSLETAGDDLAAAIKADGNAFGDASKTAITLLFQNDGLARSFKNSKLSLSDLTASIGLSDEAFMSQLNTWKKSGEVNDQQALGLAATKKKYDELTSAGKSTEEALKELGVTAAQLAQVDLAAVEKSAQADADALKSGANYAGRYADALNGLKNPVKDLAQANDDYLDGLASVNDQIKKNADAYKDNGKSLNDNTSEGRSNEKWLRDQIDNYTTIAQKQLAAGASTDQVSAALATNEQKLKNAATAAGMNKTQVQQLIDTEGNIQPIIQQQMLLDTSKALAALGNAESAVLHFYGSLNRADQMALAVQADAQIGSSAAANRANQYTGGISHAATGGGRGGLTLVGEQGPELVTLPGGSMVHSNPDTQRMMAGGGGSPTFEIHIHTDGSAMAAGVVSGLRYEVRTKGGGNVQSYLGR